MDVDTNVSEPISVRRRGRPRKNPVPVPDPAPRFLHLNHNFADAATPALTGTVSSLDVMSPGDARPVPLPAPSGLVPVVRFATIVAHTAEFVVRNVTLNRPLSLPERAQFSRGGELVRLEAHREVEAAPTDEAHRERMARCVDQLEAIVRGTSVPSELNHALPPLPTMVLLLELLDNADDSSPVSDELARHLILGCDRGHAPSLVVGALFEASVCWSGFVKDHFSTFHEVLRIVRTIGSMNAYLAVFFEPKKTPAPLPPLFTAPHGQRTPNPGIMFSTITQRPLTSIAVSWSKMLVASNYLTVRRGLSYLRRLCESWHVDAALTAKLCTEAFAQQ